MNTEYKQVANDEQAEYEVQYARLIAKCWSDATFKAKLLTNTEGTLKEEGFELAEGVTVKALENTDSLFHIVIPERTAELSDEELDGVAGGVNFRKIRAAIGRTGVTIKNHTVAGFIELKNHGEAAGKDIRAGYQWVGGTLVERQPGETGSHFWKNRPW
ncbi:NHLP leader peptide family natural product precursor [Candidatus Methylospira mobilis]|uniref:NHLP leader peptide family natural product n=2 Tax=Candidatus Methylospira mobilis TaxID=1808979 RepID=A0A5Q0BEQ6_9GAMM|nr:NHLP leader peptide family RiPP precursor [Candidatus Methylospira mobilis]QFY41989.1 NHLP leader peptide family natural product precursor [Candidatus Methylospira mobilis]WNV02981.1 NHLP leader peptide family RiPP precursor [Candidatus Methylospira mobilis]